MTAITKSKIASLRDKAVRFMMAVNPGLWNRCHWCSCVIVWWQRLPRRTILNPTTREGAFIFQGGCVRFKLVGPRKHSFPVVTVDHVVELSKGGDSSPDNLVLSCMKCNVTRSAPPQNKYPNCLDCGREKKTAKKKYCYDCMIIRSNQYLEKAGLINGPKGGLTTIEQYMRGKPKRRSPHRQLRDEQ